MVALIALPIWKANFGTDVVANQDVISLSDDTPVVANLADQLDVSKISWGIALLLSYAALSVYLNSPAMKREFKR